VREVRGSNRAVEEYAAELDRAKHDLEEALLRFTTLRDHAAGPPTPAGCCWLWTWARDALCGNWGWQRRITCEVYDYGRRCSHLHHADDGTWTGVALG
jgi:hypothetical protein